MKRSLSSLVIILSIVFCSVKISYGQNTVNFVDSIVNHAMSEFNVAGVAVGIVKDGKIVYSAGYGYKNSEEKTPVDEHTNFAIASLSKAFATTALAILVEEGKLKWDDKVVDYIPEFTMYNSYVRESFIIQDLLTHRSGMGLGMGDLMFFPDGSAFTIDDILESFQHFEPVSPFRTKYAYNNLLYIVSGEIVKRVSGMSWEDFVSVRILKALKMDNTYTAISQIKDKNNLSAPHSSDSGELVPIPHFPDMINGAAAGIYSNVDDLCKWMLLHLNEGKYGDSLENSLFKASTQREMWKIHTVLDARQSQQYKSSFAGYGLGWGVSDINGHMMVRHTGGLPGMLSKIVLIPDIDLGVVVLTNTSDDGFALFDIVSNAIVDDYLDLEKTDWINTYVTYFENRKAKADSVVNEVWKTVENADPSCINEDSFIGIYEDKWFGKVEIFEKGEQLRIKCHRSAKLNGQMHYYNANTFAIKWEYDDMNCDAFAMFSLDKDGKAQRIKMKGISPNIDFSFDFHDLNLIRVE